MNSKLNNYVKEIFSFESHSLEGTKTFRYYADGLPGIMFHQAVNGMFLNGNQKRLSELFVYGQTLKPIDISVKGPFRMIIFYLYPEMLKTLFQIDSSQIVDSCLGLDEVMPNETAALLQQLKNADHIEHQVQFMEEYLLGILPEQKTSFNMSRAIKSIELEHDNFSVSSISDDFHVTPRTFQRIFKQYVGIPPRLFARISKFNKALTDLESGEYKQLTDLALENEYSDQSHFSRTFKEFTGQTPKEFLAIMNQNENAV